MPKSVGRWIVFGLLLLSGCRTHQALRSSPDHHAARGATHPSAPASTSGHAAHQAQLAWLIDRVEIEDLLARYVRAVDRLDRTALAEVFTSDAVLEVTFADPGTQRVVQQGFEALFESMQSVLGARAEYGVPWHFVTSPRIEIDVDRARVTAYMHNQSAGAGGTYEVDAVRAEDGWRIARLHVDMTY